MWENAWQFFVSIYSNPTVEGIGIALIMGTIWLADFRMPLGKQPSLWIFLAVGAVLFIPTVLFLQTPLQAISYQFFSQILSREAWRSQLLLAQIPGMLISGFVQEGMKLVPVLIYRKRRQPLSEGQALLTGAAVGAGFGIFEAAWLFYQNFRMGFSWNNIQFEGWLGILFFVERFIAIAFHISATAVLSYYWNKNKGGRAYLIIALFHSILNYGAVLAIAQVFTTIETEVYIAVLSAILIGMALWLRWHERPSEPAAELPPESGAPA